MDDLDSADKIDIILVAGGSQPQLDETAEIARRTGGRVIRPPSGSSPWIQPDLPDEQLTQSLGPVDRITVEGISICVVGSAGSSGNGVRADTPAIGFVVIFENGWVMYFAANTTEPERQALVAEMYRPDVALMPIKAGDTPVELAEHIRELIGGSPHLSAVFAHSVEESPQEADTVIDEAQAALDSMDLDMAITPPILGHIYTLPDAHPVARRRPPAITARPAAAPEAIPMQPVIPASEGAPIEAQPPALAPIDVVLPGVVDQALAEIPPDTPPLEPEPTLEAIEEAPLASALEEPGMAAEAAEEATAAEPESLIAAAEVQQASIVALVPLEAEELSPPTLDGALECEDVLVLRPLNLLAAESEESPAWSVVQQTTEESLLLPMCSEVASETGSVALLVAYELVTFEELDLVPMKTPELPEASALAEVDAPRETAAPESETVAAALALPPVEREPVLDRFGREVKPARLDVAGVVPYVQKRRQRDYEELKGQIARLQAEVDRLTALYDEWVLHESHPEAGNASHNTRRLRESMTSEELHQKRIVLQDLLDRAAEMEARYPILVREVPPGQPV